MPSREAPKSKPAGPASGLYYLLYGDNLVAIDEELAKLRRKSGGGDAGMAELNTTLFDGRKVTMGELRHACDSIPFLSDRRLVIAHGLLSRLASDRRQDRDAPSEDEPAWKRTFVRELEAYLPLLPPTTRLVLVESKPLEKSHPIVKLALSQGEAKGAYVRSFEAPKDAELPAWIQSRVRSRKGAVSNEAAVLLANLIGRDLRLLDLELDKLLLYADGRQISSTDVRALVSQARELSIFDLVDCVGRRQADRALVLLHGLISSPGDALYVLSMLARQVRILIQVGALRAGGLSQDEIAKRAGLHPFVVQKAMAQVSSFSMAQLETAHEQCVQADWAIKTGKIDGVLALDLLVVGMGRAGEGVPSGS